MMKSIFVNGERNSSCRVTDRGLQFGDGLFETLLCLDGHPLDFSDHWHRLQRGCEVLGIACPDIRSEVQDLMGQEAASKRMIAKIIITRGYSERGYRCPENVTANWILLVSPAPEIPRSHYLCGVDVTVCRTRIALEDPKLVGLKHLNRLTQVLARREWNDEYHEGLVGDSAGNIVEGTSSNIFLVLKKGLVTPDLSYGGVHGIIRNKVINYAQSVQMPLQIRCVSLPEVTEAEEIFLTNSVYGILPVRSVNNTQFSVGPMTKRLLRGLAEGSYFDYSRER